VLTGEAGLRIVPASPNHCGKLLRLMLRLARLAGAAGNETTNKPKGEQTEERFEV